ncbi:MAG: hypothetical protein L6R41_000217 [Letrouitia leprolyta]|nr:MAG: hypothetical protein L6R41_000217 [Letrouitia leprolyta]
MAAPPEVTLKNLSGKWTMNKKLSDDTDRVLELVIHPNLPSPVLQSERNRSEA